MICRCWGVTSGSLSRCSPPCYKSPLRTERQPEDSTLCWRAASFVQGLDDSVDGYIVADGCRRCRLFAPRSRRAAGAAILRCDTQPLVGLQAPLRIVECQEPLYDLGGRAGNCASPGPILHPCSHLHAPCMLPSFACALCQSRHQRPGRGRLSVGHHSTAGAPAGRKPLKSRKARRLLHCSDEAAPPSCPSWSHRPQCLVPLPPAGLGANEGYTATGGEGSEEGGR